MIDTTAASESWTDTGAGGAEAAPTADKTLLAADAPPAAAAADGQVKDKAVQPTDGAGKDAAKADGDKAAIEYTDFQIPEGMTIDRAALDQFVPIAKELGLDQDKAQKLVSLYAEQRKAEASAQQQAWADQLAAWSDSAKADKEFGGVKFDENMAVAKQALDKFGTPELKAYLNDFGAGNHPEVIRFFHRVGKAISEDAFHAGGAAGSPKTAADVLYGGNS